MPTRNALRASIRDVLVDLLAPPLCWSCRAPARRRDALCNACRRSLRFLSPVPVAVGGLQVWAPVAYDGPAADLVKALKFHAATRLAGSMAALVVANAPGDLLAADLVPVPLHAARRRARPFNQAALLAHAIAERTGRPVTDCLARTGPDRSQVGRGRAARLSAVSSVEAIGRSPLHALLIDDVVTTGATLSVCAATLRAAGAAHVAAIAFARTVGR